MSSAWLQDRPLKPPTRLLSHDKKLPLKWQDITDFGAGAQKHLHHGRRRRILRVWKRFHTLIQAFIKRSESRQDTAEELRHPEVPFFYPIRRRILPDNKRKEKDMKEKRVIQYTQNMEEIQRYRTIREPQAIYNITHISSVCRRERKTDGGFIWRYEDDPDPRRMDIDPDEGKFSRELRYKKNRRRHYWE